MYEVRWTETAYDTYVTEASFVHSKWGASGVQKFIYVTEDFISTLKTGILVGKPALNSNVRISVISKQNSIAYTVDEENKLIHLIVFWNNKRDPIYLQQIIEQYRE